MQAGVGLLDMDVMPIFHNHCLGYLHNFALFYQLLDNLFTHRILAFKREASSETYGPGSIFHHISFRSTILQSFIFRSINQKPKNILSFVYLSLSDLTFASNREGIDNPFIALGAGCLIVCAGIGDLCILLLLD